MLSLNLDKMSEDELRSFWGRYHRASRKDAQALVGGKRPGYVTLAAKLANYAINRCAALHCHRENLPDNAAAYEHACRLILDDLPTDLHWK